MSVATETLLRRDRHVVLAALLLVTALAWVWLLSGAGMGMSAFEMTRHSMMPMPMAQPATWTPAYAVLMFFMWWIMMIAMMLPAASPVILLAAAINRSARVDTPPFGSAGAFAAGYLCAWAVFSALAVAVQWALERSGWITPMLVSGHDLFAGTVLVLAGLWQFTPWKRACLRHCRAPTEFLTRQRRPGQWGAVRMGWIHGLYCLGCCWFLMALLFVGGVMNLYWIIGLALLVWVEKQVRHGASISRLLGVGLVGWGGALLARSWMG